MRARLTETNGTPPAEGDREVAALERFAGVPLDPASIATQSAAEPAGSAADIEAIKRRFLTEYFGALTLAPRPAKVILDQVDLVVGTPDQEDPGFSHASRALVDLVLSHELDYTSIMPLHIDEALELGVPAEVLEALGSDEVEQLPDSYRREVLYTRAVVRGEVSDEQYRELATALGERGAIEFTVMVTTLLMFFRLHQAIGVAEPSWKVIEELQAEAIERRASASRQSETS